jgi:hypothetical protein
VRSARARKRGEVDCGFRVEAEEIRGVRAGSVRCRETVGWARGREAITRMSSKYDKSLGG